jgi:UDP-GlcNAc:undecaprenyl-phosphate GlcNAc-1-phosphate transferase
LGYLSLQQATAVAEIRKKNLHLRQLIKQLSGTIAKAQSREEIWRAVRPLAESIEASYLAMVFEHEAAQGQPNEIRFEAKNEAAEPNAGPPLEMKIELNSHDRRWGEMIVRWSGERVAVNRDEELALEILADAAANAAFEFFLRESGVSSRVRSLP